MGIRMNLKTFISNLRNMGREPVITRGDFSPASVPGWVYESLGLTAPITGLNPTGLNRPAENVLMVYGCITARREAIARVPLRISDGDDNLVESGPLVDLLDRPNQRQNWGQYVRQIETYNTIYNMIVVAKVGEPNQLPDELIPLSPAYLRPEFGVHAPTGIPVVTRYYYSDPMTGVQRSFLPDDLLIHRGFNPHAPLEALSPLTVLNFTISGELAAREQNLRLFANNAMPAAVLENANSMTKDQAQEVLAFVEGRLQGVANRGKLLATWGGLKLTALGLSPQEMEYLAGLKFLRTDYYIVFRVPPAMLYEMMPVEMGKGNESTESQKVEWWEDVGLAELDLIADLHQPLVDQFAGTARKKRILSRGERVQRARAIARRTQRFGSSGKMYLWADDNSIPALVRHRLAKIDQAVKVAGLGYKPDDINDYLDMGLPPHPDNFGRVAFASQPIGDGADAGETAAIRPQTADKDQKTEGKADEAAAIVDRIEAHLVARADRQSKRTEAMRRMFDALITPMRKTAARKYSRFFIEQRDRVLDRLKKVDVSARADKMMTDAMLNSIFPKDAENSALVMRLAPLWSKTLKDGWDFLNAQVGVTDNPFAVDDPRILQALEQRKIQGAHINETTEADLKGLIKASLEAGESTVELGDRIAEYYATYCVGENSVRPMTAANTQTAGLVNQGQHMAAMEVGGLEKFWIHGNPAEPREAHVDAALRYQANPIELDEPFVVNGIAMMYPGDPTAPAGEVCNCTCMVGYRIKKAA